MNSPKTVRNVTLIFPFQNHQIHHRLAALRVHCAADNHRQLCGAGARRASAMRWQNGAEYAAGIHRDLLLVHLLRGGFAEDPCLRAGAAQKLLPQKHMEYNGFFCCTHRVSCNGLDSGWDVSQTHKHHLQVTSKNAFANFVHISDWSCTFTSNAFLKTTLLHTRYYNNESVNVT